MQSSSNIDLPPRLKVQWVARRWSLKHLWYRIRQRARRKRWATIRSDLSRAYQKSLNAMPSNGPAIVFADLSGDNGLSRGALYDIAQVSERHSEVTTVDISGVISGRIGCVSVVREQFENVYFFCQPDMYEHVFPLMSREAMQDAYRIGRWVWETPNFPKSWRFANLLVHEVWSASEFSASVFRTGVSVPVHVVSHAVQLVSRPSIDVRKKFEIDPNAFVGLAVMDIRSCPERKNPWAHVLAWREAFGESPRAILIMKIRTGKRTSMVVHELADLIGKAKNVIVVDEQLSDAELDSLRRTCQVFVSLHRSEGYGLNIHEALSLGKPVVATHWSANTEYGPRYPNYHPVESRLIRYRDWTNHYEDSDFYWADPDVSDASRLLKTIYERWKLQMEKVG